MRKLVVFIFSQLIILTANSETHVCPMKGVDVPCLEIAGELYPILAVATNEVGFHDHLNRAEVASARANQYCRALGKVDGAKTFTLDELQDGVVEYAFFTREGAYTLLSQKGFEGYSILSAYFTTIECLEY